MRAEAHPRTVFCEVRQDRARREDDSLLLAGGPGGVEDHEGVSGCHLVPAIPASGCRRLQAEGAVDDEPRACLLPETVKVGRRRPRRERHQGRPDQHGRESRHNVQRPVVEQDKHPVPGGHPLAAQLRAQPQAHVPYIAVAVAAVLSGNDQEGTVGEARRRVPNEGEHYAPPGGAIRPAAVAERGAAPVDRLPRNPVPP